jgi:hypothetical protein
MQHEHHTLEPYGVDRSIGAAVPIFDNLKHTGGTEALEGFGLLVLLPGLCKVKSVAKTPARRKRLPNHRGDFGVQALGQGFAVGNGERFGRDGVADAQGDAPGADVDRPHG